LAGVCGTIRIATRRRPLHEISQLDNSRNPNFRSTQHRITTPPTHRRASTPKGCRPAAVSARRKDRPGRAAPISLCVIKQIRAGHRSGQGGCPCVVPPAAGGRADHENSRYRRIPPTRGPPQWPSRRAGRSRRGRRERGPHDQAGHPPRRSGKRAPNCSRPRIPAGAMARYLPRHRPFADGTFKCAAAAINMPGGRSRARN
jgi:hypothetical protein